MVVYLDYRGNRFFYFSDLLSLEFQLQILKQIFPFYTISVLARSCSGGPQGLISLWLLYFALRQRGNSNITNRHLTVITRKQYFFFFFIWVLQINLWNPWPQDHFQVKDITVFHKTEKDSDTTQNTINEVPRLEKRFLKRVWLFKY